MKMFKQWKKRMATGTVILVLVLAGGFFAFRMFDADGNDQKFRKMKIERGEIASAVTATGTINPVVNVLVGSQVSGTIKALHADFNSQVKEGQVIAQIDPAIFDAQVEQGRANLLNARANLTNIEANLKNAQANLAKAEVSVLDTKRTLDRNKELAKRNVVAQATLDTAQANYDSALAQRDSNKAQIESARAQIEQGKAQIEQARASLKVSETNLHYTTIRSPVNGTVISRNVDVGQTVAASLQAPTLFTIAKDLTKMQVDSNISEADVGRIAVGQDATFTVDAYPERTFRGKVSEIRNAPTTVQNVVTYDVVIQVDNKELKLKPGMTANVSVLIAHKENVLKIPNAALRFQPQTGAKEQAGEKEKSASSGKGGPGGGGGGQRPIERLAKALNLTEEQKGKAEIVLASAQQEIQEIREKSKPEDARVKIQNLIKQKIWGILSEEQKAKYGETGQGSRQGEEKKPARVWVASADGKPVPVSIFLGITNGAYSEVAGGELKEGTEVIVEEISKKKGSNQTTASPGMRGFGR
jgi:HlyD family secretion protein